MKRISSTEKPKVTGALAAFITETEEQHAERLRAEKGVKKRLVRTTVSLPEELHARLKALAERRGVSLSSLVENMCEDGLKES